VSLLQLAWSHLRAATQELDPMTLEVDNVADLLDM
jgi:hypothetical protein